MKKLKLSKETIASLTSREMKKINGGSFIAGCDMTNVPDQCCTDKDKLCPCPEKN